MSILTWPHADLPLSDRLTLLVPVTVRDAVPMAILPERSPRSWRRTHYRRGSSN